MRFVEVVCIFIEEVWGGGVVGGVNLFWNFVVFSRSVEDRRYFRV